MPHLVRMDSRYAKKGLRVIGEECQNSSVDAIEGVAKDKRVKFPITKGGTRPSNMKGIPHAVVFDATGQMVFSGHPSEDEFDRSVKKALKGVKAEDEEEDSNFPSAPKPIIEERAWTNADGQTIKAAVLKIEEDSVLFKMNGREITYPIEKLSEEDQELIKEAAEAAEEDE